jgi:coenzyme PQQ precursor peptide PqqA
LSQAALNPDPKQTVGQENVMKTKVWTRPEVKEVSLGCEINCYAPAEI